MEPKVKPLNPRTSPRLDVLLSGSDEVNHSRAEHSPSLAVPSEGDLIAEVQPVEAGDTADPKQMAQVALQAVRQARFPTEQVAPTAEVKDLSRRVVAERVSQRERDPEPSPDIQMSLFIKLDRDLDPERRKAVQDSIEQRARRVCWKLDTAAVEMAASDIADLVHEEAIAYIETGQSLNEPAPLVGRTDSPHPRGRSVPAARSRHHDGEGVVLGIIDVGGFDFAHPDFLRDGTTRWEAIWDQGGSTRPPPDDLESKSGLSYGSEIHRSHMNAALVASRRLGVAATELEPQSLMVPRSHGTHVASIAAGNSGVAPKAHLAGVLVSIPAAGDAATSSFYDSTRIADAIEYLLRVAARLGGEKPLPLSINISLGTNGHAHDTSSPMARWIDNALATRGRCVSVAAGNSGQVEASATDGPRALLGRIHAGGVLAATNLRQELGWVVGGEGISDYSENEMEIWYAPQDRFDVEVRPPGGAWVGPVPLGKAIRHEFLDDGTVLSIHSEAYHPANGLNRISILLSPFYGNREGTTQEKRPITSGEWRVRLTGVVVRDGRFDAWIERDDPRALPGGLGRWNYPSRFSEGSYTSDRMIGSLACAERLLSVANADLARNAAHVTSSRGPTRDGRPKPDIAADGTQVVAACGFSHKTQWVQMTGTSMASPYVAGVAALMLGVVPQLTSAQIQGIMRSTSAPLPGQTFGWRNDTGFGVIDADACLRRTVEFREMFEALSAPSKSSRSGAR
ncbi:MAG: S8 family serine peptidase [Dermatophilaceae bacterium]|nr:S8 family serine peptidase [Intrasporangiaceae bacterium]